MDSSGPIAIETVMPVSLFIELTHSHRPGRLAPLHHHLHLDRHPLVPVSYVDLLVMGQNNPLVGT